MAYIEEPDFRQSGIGRLAFSVAAIESLFPDSWARYGESQRPTWPDRMGLVHQLDDRWNYVQQPQNGRLQGRDGIAWAAPSPPREISVATVRALFPNLAQGCEAPILGWDNGFRKFGVRDWPIADHGAVGDEEDEEEESDWESEFEYDWESDSGIDSGSESSDDDSWEDSWSEASSTSSMRQPSPNEYLRRLEEVEDLGMDMHGECPYCERQIQHVYEAYQINGGAQQENYRRGHW